MSKLSNYKFIGTCVNKHNLVAYARIATQLIVVIYICGECSGRR